MSWKLQHGACVWAAGRWRDLTHWPCRASQVESQVRVFSPTAPGVVEGRELLEEMWLGLVIISGAPWSLCWCPSLLLSFSQLSIQTALGRGTGTLWRRVTVRLDWRGMGSWQWLLNLSPIRRCIRKVICSQELMSRPANCLTTSLAKLGMSKGKAMIGGQRGWKEVNGCFNLEKYL